MSVRNRAIGVAVAQDNPKMRQDLDEMEQLSPREQQVLEKLAEGRLVKEIADQLGLGFGTVRTYIRRVYEKLGVRSRSQAAALYYRSQAGSHFFHWRIATEGCSFTTTPAPPPKSGQHRAEDSGL